MLAARAIIGRATRCFTRFRLGPTQSVVQNSNSGRHEQQEQLSKHACAARPQQGRVGLPPSYRDRTVS